jgi:clan AA aspartic protease (TIGR02281 family)
MALVTRRILFFVLSMAGLAAWANSNPAHVAQASAAVMRAGEDLWRRIEPAPPLRTVEVQRGRNGGFALSAKVNGMATPMVLDTGATSVMLTYDAAKAAGLPLEVLKYTVEVQTANGALKTAPVTLDRIAVGKLVETSVPALVAPPGQLKANLLGASFLDRLESWEVRTDKLMMRGYP